MKRGQRIFLISAAALLMHGGALGQQVSSASDSQNPACKPQTPAATTPFDTCKYLTIGPGIRPPKAVRTPQPTYPEPARKPKLSGVVVVALAINENGYVDDVKVVRSSNRIFEQNTMDAVRQWVFTPATRDSQPVAVQIDSETNFKLY